MTYDEIHPAMRAAIGTFETLRRFGFESDDIFFHQNADESPGGLEPRGMMFVVLMTQGKQFSIRVGVVDVPYETWKTSWEAVATAASEKQIEEVDRMLYESEAFREKVGLMVAIQAKGIRIPVAQRNLS
jgi:hypothetical protein